MNRKKVAIFAANLKVQKYMTTTAMTQLWAYLESLGLSTKNRKWLADKLVEPTKNERLEKEERNAIRIISAPWPSDGLSEDEFVEMCVSGRNSNRDIAEL